MTKFEKVTIEDFVSLQGRRVPLPGSYDTGRFGAADRRAMHKSFVGAAPFPHIVLDNLFDPILLDAIVDEFQSLDGGAWRHAKCDNESTRRSPIDLKLGPAAEHYFAQIHSRNFVQLVSDISGVDILIPDAQLIGGGLHESRTGDWFNIHTDFAKHPRSLLPNELVIITYLNRGWEDDWGGALELWSAQTQECIKDVVPVFGRTIIFKSSPVSLHGHTKPVNAPDGRPRRSIAAYYYGVAGAAADVEGRELASVFSYPRKSLLGRTKAVVRAISPPVFVDLFKFARARLDLNHDWITPKTTAVKAPVTAP